MTASATRLTANRGRVVYLDGLRGIPVTTVVDSHGISWPGIPFGRYPGALVFMLSSYLISNMLWTFNPPPGWSDFLTHTRAAYAVVAAQAPTSTALIDWRHWQMLGRDTGFILIQAP